MAKRRYVNTVFWSDNYITNLDPIEKLLFIYLITNGHTNISGVYQIPIKTIATDTGIDRDMVLKIIDRFQKDNKILYHDGWIAIKNFIKHQNINSPMIKTCIENELKNIPDTVSIWYQTTLDSYSISISKSISKGKNIRGNTVFKPPSLEMIKQYITDNNLNVDCEYFFKFFTEGNWVDTKGNKVKNWKQKLLTWHKHTKIEMSESEKAQKLVKEFYDQKESAK